MKFVEYLNSPIFWLRRVHLATRKAVDEELGCFELTAPQFEILKQLWEHDGLEQRALQERLGITSPTLTGIIDGLVERQYVERRISAEDARVKQLFLTERGRTMQVEMGTAVARAQARLLEGFSASEAALLADWLKRMARNMGATGDGCD